MGIPRGKNGFLYHHPGTHMVVDIAAQYRDARLVKDHRVGGSAGIQLKFELFVGSKRIHMVAYGVAIGKTHRRANRNNDKATSIL